MQLQPQQKQKAIFFDPSEQQVVGIEQYIVTGQQIPAITKYLLSDFIVNQINTQQQVVVLQNKPLSLKSTQNQKKQANYSMNPQLFEEIKVNLSPQAAKQVQSLYERLQSGQKQVEWEFVMIQIPKQKSQRLKLHNFVRQRLQNIQSNTLEGNKIRLKFNHKLRKMKPQSRHKYIHFKLFKSNIDTMSALFKLSKLMNISHKIFSSAGLKDKRGITTQMVSIFNSDINNIKRFFPLAHRNREMWIDGIKENQDDAIAMGCLFGNQFGLILRLINPQQIEQLQKRIQVIRQFGIINYFGMQRFGSCATRTHLIGVKIIKKQWKQLVETLLLQKTGNEHVDRIKRQIYEQKSYEQAQRLLSNKYKIQKSLFKGLSRHGNNYYNVFQNLPRTMKTLYCHALQSYLWNKITSRRIRQHGTKLVIGDLVGINKKEIIQEKNINQEDKKEEDEEFLGEADDQVDVEDIPMEVVLITQDNIHKYKFQDMVAPLYGVSINLPQQSIINTYLEKQLFKLDLLKTDFQQKSKTLCFKGAYRKCIVRPPLIECEIISHKDKKAQLLSPFYMKDQKVEYESGDLKSAKVILQLPKSSYATIAIRQILHIPSSFKVQNQLNRMYQNQQKIKQNVE